jgi:hypothetical protein
MLSGSTRVATGDGSSVMLLSSVCKPRLKPSSAERNLGYSRRVTFSRLVLRRTLALRHRSRVPRGIPRLQPCSAQVPNGATTWWWGSARELVALLSS